MSDATIVHVVDADAHLRDSAAALLTVLGHEAVLWDSGGQFLARANPKPGECILLDIKHAGLGGIEVLSRLAAWGITTPVVIMADAGEGREAELMARGAVWLLDKPFSLADLRRALAIAETASARLAGVRAGLAPLRRVEG